MAEIAIADKPLADAENFEEFKSLRGGRKETAAPAVDAEKTPQGEEPISETAAASEPAEKTTTQQEEAPASAEERIKALRAKGKHAAANKLMADEAARPEKERADKLQQELDALRRKPAEPQQAAAAPAPEAAKPQAATVDPNDPEPQLTDAKYQAEGGFLEHQRDLARWLFRQEQKAAEQRTAQQAHQAKGQKLMADGRTAHPDFDAVANRVAINRQVLHDAVQKLDNFSEVLYKLGGDPAELTRIQALDPPDQWAEIRWLSRDLSKAATTPPPQPAQPQLKQAVTKAAAPPRVLTGGRDEGVQKTTAEASDYDEFKRIRKMRRSA